VLATGLEGSDLFQFAFMTPFNAIMLALWYPQWMRLRRAWFKPPAGGVNLICEPGRTRARLSPCSPFAAGLAATTLLAFLSIFVVCFFWGGWHPAMSTMLATWSVILGGGLAVGAWQGLRAFCGTYDLTIDEVSGCLELPLTHGRKKTVRVPFCRIEKLQVETIQKPCEDRPSVTYAPTLFVSGEQPISERLAEWPDADKARQFMNWLRDKIPPQVPPARPLAGRFGSDPRV